MIQSLMLLSSLFPNFRLDKPTTAAWMEVFGEESPDLFKKAITALARSGGLEFPPTASDVSKELNNLKAEDMLCLPAPHIDECSGTEVYTKDFEETNLAGKTVVKRRPYLRANKEAMRKEILRRFDIGYVPILEPLHDNAKSKILSWVPKTESVKLSGFVGIRGNKVPRYGRMSRT